MNIELKNVKYCKWASEETDCYDAVVYIDGKRAFSASNDGRGGCDNYYPIGEGGRALLESAEEYAKSLPPVKSSYFPEGLQWDLELLIGDLLYKHLAEKDYMTKSRKKTVFKLPDDPDNVYHMLNSTGDDAIAYIKKDHPGARIFNRKTKKFE